MERECAAGCGALLMEDEDGPLCCECWQKERHAPPEKGAPVRRTRDAMLSNSDSDREQAAQGALLLHRLIPAPDHGRGFRRDPDTGFVYYSSEWLSDERESDDAAV